MQVKFFTPRWRRDTSRHVLCEMRWNSEEIEWQARSITKEDNDEGRNLLFYFIIFVCTLKNVEKLVRSYRIYFENDSNLLQLYKSHVHSHKFYGTRTLSFDWFHQVWFFRWHSSVKLKKQNLFNPFSLTMINIFKKNPFF